MHEGYVPYSFEGARTGNDTHLVLEPRGTRGGVEVRLDGLEAGKGPLAKVVLGRHGVGKAARSGRRAGKKKRG